LISVLEAKYPFMRRAIEVVGALGFRLEELSAYGGIVERGFDRVREAIVGGVVSARLEHPDRELLSFPVALMFVSLIGDPFLDRRYALAEGKRAYRLLREEPEEVVAEVAKEFNWDLRPRREVLDGQLYSFELHFEDYLRNASGFHEDKWKLVNRLMVDGYILLTKTEAARLLQGEVEALVLSRVSRHRRIRLPDALEERVEALRGLLEKHRGRIGGEALPREVVVEAFPPCVRHIFEVVTSGRKASHMERFTLVSFLLNAGMSVEKLTELFTSVSDFDPEMTRYQVEHIAGLRGSRTRYKPPNCDTLRTHGICQNPDALCRRVRNPITYYMIKVRSPRRRAARKTGRRKSPAQA